MDSRGRPDLVRETILQTKISLTNVNVLLPRVTATWFSELLPSLLFDKNNQFKIINIPKDTFWDGKNYLPSGPKGKSASDPQKS